MTRIIDTDWARRSVLAAGLGLATMPRNSFGQVVNAQAIEQVEPDGKGGVRFAAREDPGQRMTIDVMINGQGPFRFIVDTGAERSVLSDEVVARLGLPPGRSITISGVTGRVIAPTAKVHELGFGPFRRHDLTLPVLSGAALTCDGYLGLDAIDKTRVTFDFTRQEIRIEEAGRLMKEKEQPDVVHVRSKGSGGYLRIMNCLVDTVLAMAFIDTGAEVSVGNTALMAAMGVRNRNFAPGAYVMLTGATGGQLQGQVIPVRRIRLQDLAFTDGTLIVADVPDFDLWKGATRPSLLIGMDYLRQFASVSLDYRTKDIRFELSAAPPRPLPSVSIETV